MRMTRGLITSLTAVLAIHTAHANSPRTESTTATCMLTVVDHFDNRCDGCPGTGEYHSKMHISPHQAPAVFSLDLSQNQAKFDFDLQCTGPSGFTECSLVPISTPKS